MSAAAWPWLALALIAVVFAYCADRDARESEKDAAWWESEARRCYAERPIDPRIANASDETIHRVYRDIFSTVKPSPIAIIIGAATDAEAIDLLLQMEAE